MRWTAAGFVAVTVGVLAAAVPAGAAPSPVISVLSSRPDLVSDGNAAVAIRVPRHGRRGLRVTVNRRDVTKRFARRANGRVEGLVSGLTLGRNVLVARLRNGRGARL